MNYPKIKLNYSDSELKDYFTLSYEEKKLLKKIRKETNVLGFAVLLKTYQYLGCAPQTKKMISSIIIDWIAKQLKLSVKTFVQYRWKSRIFKFHLSMIREYTKYSSYVEKKAIKEILFFKPNEILKLPVNRSSFYKLLIEKFRKNKMELPLEKKFIRLANSSFNNVNIQLFHVISEKISPELKLFINKSLKKNKSDIVPFDWSLLKDKSLWNQHS